MKSIKQQYIDLKEGKMSQSNFMRNLRMTMPQYVTSVTSFGDAVKILKNKGILNESLNNFDEIKVLSKQEEPKIKSGGSLDLDLMFRDLYTKPFLGGYYLDYNFENPHRLIIHISKEPAKDGQRTNEIEKLGTAECTDGEWHFDGVRPGNNDQEILDKIATAAFPNINEEFKPETEETSDDDTEFDAILKQIEDEMYGERVTKSDVLDEPLEESDTYDIEKAIKDKKIDPAVVKTAAEKAMKGDSTDLALLMVNAGNLREGKGKDLHPNTIHPGELRMGIRVEMEHTDDVEKAKKIALDHLAENPYYYTALKLSGIESPTKLKEKPVKEKKAKKDTVELVDKANQMQKVKMPKAEEKKKLKEVEEAQMRFKDLPADPEKYKIVKDSKGYIIKATNADGVEFQKGDVAKTYDGEEIKIAKFEESQGKVKAIYSKGMFYTSIDIDGLEAGKPEFRPGVNIGGSFEKFKNKIAEMVREVMAENK